MNWPIGTAAVFTVMKVRILSLMRVVEQTPGGVAKLVNSGVVEQDVSNGDDILAC